MEQIRIIKEMHKKHGTDYPRFMVWENVPGALSSNKGEDFRIVLEETARIAEADAVIPGPPKGKWKNSGCVMGDGWSIAWRILDAQFWGVPQRRRRIALVADFGGESAPEILFERKGVSGYSAEGFRTWQRAARGASPCVGATGFDGYNEELTGDVSATLGVNCGMSTGRNGIVLNDQSGSRMDVSEDVSATLRSENHGHAPVVMRPAEYAGAFHINQRGEGIDLHDISGALMATQSDQMSTFIAEKKMKSAGFCTEPSSQSRSIGYEEEKSPPLRAGTVPAVVYENHSQDTRYTGPLETAPTVMSTYGTDGNNQPFVVETLVATDFKDPPTVSKKPEYIVRRLTPTECERLQGFPDGWTDIGDYTDSNGKKKKSSDTARYRALGNSIALPPWRWVLSRLCRQCKTPATMGSLFDGIGGFPLIWEEINGKGSCLWASEIEEFPIAVTKIRFSE